MPAQGEPQPTSIDASVSGLPPIIATRPASQPGGFRGLAGKVAGALGRGQGEIQGSQPSYVVSQPLGEPTLPTAPAWTPDATPGVQPAGNPDLTGNRQAPELPADPWTQPTAKPAPTGIPTTPRLDDLPEPTFPASPVPPAPKAPIVAPALPEDPFAPAPPQAESTAQLEPAVSTQAVVSPVWTPEPHDAAIEPQPIPTPWDRPTGEPIDSDTTSEAPQAGSGTETSTARPPMFRKVVDGDLIRYELTPEGRQGMKDSFVKMIDSGALDSFAAELAESMADISKKPTTTTDTQSGSGS